MELKAENELKIAEDAMILIRRIAIDISKQGLHNQQLEIEFSIPFLSAVATDKTGRLPVRKVNSQKVIVQLRDTPNSKKVYGFSLKLLIELDVTHIGNLKVIEWPSLDLYKISTNIQPYQILGFKNIRQVENKFWVAEQNITSKIRSHIARKRTSRIELIGNKSLPVFYIKGSLLIDCSAGGRLNQIYLSIPQDTQRHSVEIYGPDHQIIEDPNQNQRIKLDNPCSPGQIEKLSFKIVVKMKSIEYFQSTFAYPSIKIYQSLLNSRSDLFEGNSYWNVNDLEIKKVAAAAMKFDSIWKRHRFLFEFTNRRIQYSVNGIRFPASKAFHEQAGDCSEFADLLITLHRLAGIPSRLVEGLILLSNDHDSISKVEGHAWVEFLSPSGWIPCDPTWGIPIGVTSQHITLQRQWKEPKPYSFSFASQGPEPQVQWDLSFLGVK